MTIPAALSITAPYPAPCGAAAPAVPAARCCKRSCGFARLLSLLYQRKIVTLLKKVLITQRRNSAYTGLRCCFVQGVELCAPARNMERLPREITPIPILSGIILSFRSQLSLGGPLVHLPLPAWHVEAGGQKLRGQRVGVDSAAIWAVGW